MNLVQSIRSRPSQRMTIDDYATLVNDAFYNGVAYNLQQTYQDRPGERVEGNFSGRVTGAYKANGVIFACMLSRLLLFSEARFMFRQLRKGRPGELFATPALQILESPWPNGSTGELLAKMIQDVDLAGNAFVRRTGPLANPRLERLRPDWVTIILGSTRGSDLLTAEVVGYVYEPGGPGSGQDPISLAPSEVAHWSPIPDPIAGYRGMSWLTPVIREISADKAATDHKLQFFEHAATPNMVVKFDPSVTPERARQYQQLLEMEHRGAQNAYKTMYMGGGADATVVRLNFQQMTFREVQGAGETRIAAAAGVPPVIVGLSEGLAAPTYSNYAQARRRFADGTMRPLWRSCASALQSIVPAPERSMLWYDDADIAFLAEDVKDAAEIQEIRARTIAQLVRDGFTPESVVAAVMAEDLTLLQHSGKLSVQLKDPNEAPPPNAPPSTNGSTPELEPAGGTP